MFPMPPDRPTLIVRQPDFSGLFGRDQNSEPTSHKKIFTSVKENVGATRPASLQIVKRPVTPPKIFADNTSTLVAEITNLRRIIAEKDSKIQGLLRQLGILTTENESLKRRLELPVQSRGTTFSFGTSQGDNPKRHLVESETNRNLQSEVRTLAEKFSTLEQKYAQIMSKVPAVSQITSLSSHRDVGDYGNLLSVDQSSHKKQTTSYSATRAASLMSPGTSARPPVYISSSGSSGGSQAVRTLHFEAPNPQGSAKKSQNDASLFMVKPWDPEGQVKENRTVAQTLNSTVASIRPTIRNTFFGRGSIPVDNFFDVPDLKSSNRT